MISYFGFSQSSTIRRIRCMYGVEPERQPLVSNVMIVRAYGYLFSVSPL